MTLIYLQNKYGISILEALSATGLRSIRYGKEIPYVDRIVANDISLKAVDSIKKNIEHNKMDHLITANHQDATYVYSISFIIVRLLLFHY